MSVPLYPSETIFDELVIRLWRQTYSAAVLSHDDDPQVFQAQVRQTPAPLQGGAFRVDVEQQLEQFQRLFENEIRFNRLFDDDGLHGIEPYHLADLGRSLYELLPLSFREEFPRLIQRVLERGHGIRLVIEAQADDRAARLLSLPWELLFFRTPLYAAHSPRTRVVRRLLGGARRSPARFVPSFQLIHVVADHPDRPIEPSLIKMEREAIVAAVPSDHYTAVAGPGSLQRLVDALQTGHAQVVHFLGHGEVWSGVNGRAHGYLLFVDEQGQWQRVTGDQLQRLLGEATGIQLVVLSACETASSGGIALDLVYSGFPYVVAMQGPISQAAASDFTTAFYRALQREWNVEAAVAAGRTAIAVHRADALDWCLPVLYTGEGVNEQPPLPKTADAIGQWLLHPAALRRLSAANLTLGALQLTVGLLALLSEAEFPLPDARLVTGFTVLLALVPPLLTAFIRVPGLDRKHVGIQKVKWSRSTHIGFLFRRLGAAAIALGLGWLYVNFVLVLCAGLGAWATWSLSAQTVALVVLASLAILLSYQQVRGHGLGFITNAEVEPEPFDWRELSVVMGGYLLLWLPVALVVLWGNDLRPPWGNFIIGLCCLILAYALHSDDGAMRSASHSAQC